MISTGMFRTFVLLSGLISSCSGFIAPNRVFSTSSKSTRLHETDQSNNDKEKRRRLAEFLNLEPVKDSHTRSERKRRESHNRVQFSKFGDDLWELRNSMTQLSAELVEAINQGDEEVEYGLRETLRKLEFRDPELVYQMEMEDTFQAQSEGRMVDYNNHMKKALDARSCLPQFNLEGLWVGKYGNHGYEMINVTYSGDTMLAYKVTGDKNVPRGELTFQADLSPLKARRDRETAVEDSLQPIILTEKAAKKWGTKQLPRYHGLGQVAEEGFINSQWMDGQLIIIGEDYFSFAWVPIEHQIFFGRPSPELALKMLRDGGASGLKEKTWDSPPGLEDDPSLWKDFAAHCLDMTANTIEDDLSGDEFGCIWHGIETEECYFE